jgi:hypothetical protein
VFLRPGGTNSVKEDLVAQICAAHEQLPLTEKFFD